MHGIITMLRALRYDLEKEGYEEILEEYEELLSVLQARRPLAPERF